MATASVERPPRLGGEGEDLVQYKYKEQCRGRLGRATGKGWQPRGRRQGQGRVRQDGNTVLQKYESIENRGWVGGGDQGRGKGPREVPKVPRTEQDA